MIEIIGKAGAYSAQIEPVLCLVASRIAKIVFYSPECRASRKFQSQIPGKKCLYVWMVVQSLLHKMLECSVDHS
jgi:hypothetical protein